MVSAVAMQFTTRLLKDDAECSKLLNISNSFLTLAKSYGDPIHIIR